MEAVRRPRYLVVALVAALVFGAGCWTYGYGYLAFYRGEHEQVTSVNAAIRNDDDRARADLAYQRFLDTAENNRGRVIPMAAATFVLGAALLALATRGLSGKSNTRGVLMQVVVAQALVVGASYFVTRDLRHAELDWQFEQTFSHQRESLSPEAMRNWIAPGWLMFRTVASILIVVALSRPRSRAFFEARATSER